MNDVAVYTPVSEFTCLACGAKYLPQARARQSLCDACETEHERWVRQSRLRGKDAANVLNRWLARRLILEAKRFEKFGVTGRCEAVSGVRGGLDPFNNQCRGHATHMRDGKRVCGLHFAAKSPRYSGTASHDLYHEMGVILTRLGRADPRFSEMLEQSLRDIKR